MSSRLQFFIAFSSGERFQFQWEVGLDIAAVKRTRAILAKQYALRDAESRFPGRPPFQDLGVTDMEPITPATPRVYSPHTPGLPTKDTYSYEVIGGGSSAIVHYAIDLHNGEQYAVKKLKFAANHPDQRLFMSALEQFKTEVESLACFKHVSS